MAPKSKTAAAPNGSAKTASAVDKKGHVESVAPISGRPDKKLYDEEQERLKTEIDALQIKFNAVREKISLATKGGNGNERRNELRAELEGLRGQQAGNKASRGKILDQVKALQEGIQKKIKDIQAAQSKISYKNVAEVDARIKTLEKQVESGNMKVADEKRAVQEISTCKRNRHTVEGFQAIQDSIEADRKTIEELRNQLDDPDFKSTSDRFDAIKAELDELKKQGDEAYAGRSKLFEERDGYQDKINILWTQKRESTANHREANDRYWNKVNEDRARRAERARAQRAAEELEKKQAQAQHIREEAEFPAYEAEIQDCQTLIDHFSGKTTGSVTLKSAPDAFEKAEVAGVPKLEIRQVDAAPEGAVVHKKKGDDGASYFVATKGKGKGKKSAPKPPAADDNSKLNVPLPILVTLSKFAIPAPNSTADVARVVTDLTTKKAWYLANQEKQTKENVARAEARIQALAVSAGGTPSASADVSVPAGKGECPPEPAPTPRDAESLAAPVASTPLDEKLEIVEENGNREKS